VKPAIRVGVIAAALVALLGNAAIAEVAGRVLFVSNRAGNAQIHIMNPDGSDERALTNTPQENTEPAWSPDGRRIAFTSYRDGNADIYVMDADGSRQLRLTQDSQADNGPGWTSDGRIVFRSMRNRWANFYVMDADGSNLKPLTTSEQDKGVPAVSPDGQWIAYVGHGEQGSTDIFLLPTRGGTVRNMTGALSKSEKSFPSWAPDSQRLAYVEAKGLSLNVKVIGVDGSHAGNITDNAYTNAYPIWSPDGGRIAFVSSREGTRTEMARGDIYVMNANGSGATNLTRHPEEDNYPAWSADGRQIYFVSLRTGNAQIYAVPADGGSATRLTHNAGYDLMIRPQSLPAAH
jgi:Tol biopolymer transport system component